jgi:single-strand DNA-binding protein
MNLNRVVLAGNLARDPNLRFLPSGTAKCMLTLAISRPPDKQGERVTDFLTVIAWRKHAEVLGEHARKGDPLILEGRLQARDFTTEDGQKRHVLEVLLTDFSFVGNSHVEGDEEAKGTEELPAPKEGSAALRLTRELRDTTGAPNGIPGQAIGPAGRPEGIASCLARGVPEDEVPF